MIDMNHIESMSEEELRRDRKRYLCKFVAQLLVLAGEAIDEDKEFKELMRSKIWRQLTYDNFHWAVKNRRRILKKKMH
jgi:hypothetical protein